MRSFKFINRIIDAIKDPERDFSERVYLALSLISELCVFPAFIADIVTGENVLEIITIAATLILVPTITYVSLHFNWVDIAIKITVIGLVVAVMPLLFFFGGGVRAEVYSGSSLPSPMRGLFFPARGVQRYSY